MERDALRTFAVDKLVAPVSPKVLACLSWDELHDTEASLQSNLKLVKDAKIALLQKEKFDLRNDVLKTSELKFLSVNLNSCKGASIESKLMALWNVIVLKNIHLICIQEAPTELYKEFAAIKGEDKRKSTPFRLFDDGDFPDDDDLYCSPICNFELKSFTKSSCPMAFLYESNFFTPIEDSGIKLKTLGEEGKVSRYSWVHFSINLKHGANTFGGNNEIVVFNVHLKAGKINKRSSQKALSMIVAETRKFKSVSAIVICGDFNLTSTEICQCKLDSFSIMCSVDTYKSDGKAVRLKDNALISAKPGVFVIGSPIVDISKVWIQNDLVTTPTSDHFPIWFSLKFSDDLRCVNPKCTRLGSIVCSGPGHEAARLVCVFCLHKCACGEFERCTLCALKLLKSKEWFRCKACHFADGNKFLLVHSKGPDSKRKCGWNEHNSVCVQCYDLEYGYHKDDCLGCDMCINFDDYE